MSARIKAVVMSHNQPASTDELHGRLSRCFDVTVFDSGSDEGRSPTCPSERLPNLYWTGCWNEAMRRYGAECDFLWVLGGDVELLNEPEEYAYYLGATRAYNVACWSPAVRGKARPFMKADAAAGKVHSVYHLEGQALALSAAMMRAIGCALPSGSRLGWGVDVWLSWKGWTSGMRNILEGRVALGHPEGTGYDCVEAGEECERFLSAHVGGTWQLEARMVPFLERFENNIREETR